MCDTALACVCARVHQVDFEEFAVWWTAQQGEGGKWELDLLATLGKTKRWGERVGDGLVPPPPNRLNRSITTLIGLQWQS